MKDLTDIIQKVAAAFDCKSLEIFRCQQLKCYDGVQPIKSLSSGCDDDDDFVLEHGKAYSIDIAMATGDPKVITTVICMMLVYPFSLLYFKIFI